MLNFQIIGIEGYYKIKILPQYCYKLMLSTSSFEENMWYLFQHFSNLKTFNFGF
jgi:hypothetical protein